jgi:hypothetical protein
MTNKGPAQTAEYTQQELLTLKTEWQKHFKITPPKKSSRAFLFKNIAWQKQAKEQGVSLAKFYKTMEVALERFEAGKKVKPELIIKSGTKLIRQWRGWKHEVTVIGSVFIYKEEAYKSLSAIAKKEERDTDIM